MNLRNVQQLTLQLRYHRLLTGATGGSPPTVEGELECDDGSIRPFIGWLGLVNELERLVTESG